MVVISPWIEFDGEEEAVQSQFGTLMLITYMYQKENLMESFNSFCPLL
jgi:hypothetical protein